MKRYKAFTLIELLIVMSVIAILISIALPSFRGMQQQSRIVKAQGDLRSIKEAIESYYSNNGAYPAAANYQITLQNALPQILSTTLNDPFVTGVASPYSYALSPSSTYYIIFSIGVAQTGNASIADTGIVSASGGAIWDGNGH